MGCCPALLWFDSSRVSGQRVKCEESLRERDPAGARWHRAGLVLWTGNRATAALEGGGGLHSLRKTLEAGTIKQLAAQSSVLVRKRIKTTDFSLVSFLRFFTFFQKISESWLSFHFRSHLKNMFSCGHKNPHPYSRINQQQLTKLFDLNRIWSKKKGNSAKPWIRELIINNWSLKSLPIYNISTWH